MTRRRKVYGDRRDDIAPAVEGMRIAIEEMMKGGTAEDALRRLHANDTPKRTK